MSMILNNKHVRFFLQRLDVYKLSHRGPCSESFLFSCCADHFVLVSFINPLRNVSQNGNILVDLLDDLLRAEQSLNALP
jgi:hypothetical protein